MITTILAIFSTMLSSFALGWNIYRDVINRGRLKVVCYIGNTISAISGFDKTDLLVWKVTNIGKESVVLTHIGGALGNDKHFMVTTGTPLPKTLQPGEYILEHSPEISVLGKGLKALWAIDSLDRYYKAPRRQVSRMIKKYKRGEYK